MTSSIAKTIYYVSKTLAISLFRISTYSRTSVAVLTLWLTWKVTESVSEANSLPCRLSTTIYLVRMMLWRP